MRDSFNPNRDLKGIEKDCRPVVCLITHWPGEEIPYHAHRREIIKACLTSARQRAGARAYYAVWDNGSDEWLRTWIQEVYRPDTFVQSVNVGKVNACKHMMQLFSGRIMAISDDDIMYYDGWLAESLRLLKWPNVGQVSACPSRINMTSCAATLAWAGDKSAAAPFPDEWDEDHARSLGMWNEDGRPNRFLEGLKKRPSLKIGYDGAEAWAGATHCQYVCRTNDIEPFLRFSNRIMPPEAPYDREIDQAGMLRLFTAERYSRHIGNVPDERDLAEFKELAV